MAGGGSGLVAGGVKNIAGGVENMASGEAGGKQNMASGEENIASGLQNNHFTHHFVEFLLEENKRRYVGRSLYQVMQMGIYGKLQEFIDKQRYFERRYGTPLLEGSSTQFTIAVLRCVGQFILFIVSPVYFLE